MKTLKNYNEYVKESYDSISDLRNFEEKLYEVVSEYIEEMDLYSDEEIYLTVNRKTLDISYGHEDLEEENNDYYPIKDCITGDNEPDSDIISDIASKYIFVR